MRTCARTAGVLPSFACHMSHSRGPSVNESSTIIVIVQYGEAMSGYESHL